MKKTWIVLVVLGLAGGMACAADAPQAGVTKPLKSDTFVTEMGKLKITFIGHGTLVFDCNDIVIHVDPWTRLTDYAKLPKADLVLVTHEHPDHLDAKAIDLVTKAGTEIFCTQTCFNSLKKGTVMKNGDTKTFGGVKIEAVPAYNLANNRSGGQVFHPQGTGNGYVVTFGKTKIYIAGDTDCIPEMKTLQNIDAAFLPMNLPYTMTPEMVADAAKAFKPKILYPYHFGQTDTQKLVDLLKDTPAVEVRIRDMQ